MQTKLTLRVDDKLIRKMKRYSNKAGKSISRLVADYFTLIEAEDGKQEQELTPRVRSLYGALSGSKISEKDYWRHIEEKHQ